jgi:hypothetical protein
MSKAERIGDKIYIADNFRMNGPKKWADVKYWNLGRWREVAEPWIINQVAERLWKG